MIMDGFGFAAPMRATRLPPRTSRTSTSCLLKTRMTQIGASGMDVGLPDGQMGNSEVGHTNIGAGRIVYQELTRITKAIAGRRRSSRTKRSCTR